MWRSGILSLALTLFSLPITINYAFITYLPFISRVAPLPTIVNPDFEQGYGGDCIIWVCDYEKDISCSEPTKQEYCNDEQDVPYGWILTTWDQFPCDCVPSCTGEPRTRLPEIRLIDGAIYPERVCSGRYALQGFTFWSCGHYTLSQTITVALGQTLTAGMQAQTWNDKQFVRICLNDICSNWYTNLLSCVQIVTPEITMDTQNVTLTLEFLAIWPFKNNDGYFDDVWIKSDRQ